MQLRIVFLVICVTLMTNQVFGDDFQCYQCHGDNCGTKDTMELITCSVTDDALKPTAGPTPTTPSTPESRNYRSHVIRARALSDEHEGNSPTTMVPATPPTTSEPATSPPTSTTPQTTTSEPTTSPSDSTTTTSSTSTPTVGSTTSPLESTPTQTTTVPTEPSTSESTTTKTSETTPTTTVPTTPPTSESTTTTPLESTTTTPLETTSTTPSESTPTAGSSTPPPESTPTPTTDSTTTTTESTTASSSTRPPSTIATTKNPLSPPGTDDRFACYTVQYQEGDQSITKKGCVATLPSQAACDIVEANVGVNLEKCDICLYTECNSGAIFKLSMLTLLGVLFVRLLI